MENERVGAITLLGNERTLVGSELKVGDPAPEFSVLGTDVTFPISNVALMDSIISFWNCGFPPYKTSST